MKLLIFAVLLGLSQASLLEDFNEFLALIPRDEIKAIAKKHLDTDPEFQELVTYLQGPEWAQLVAEVRAKPETQEFHKFMLEAGVDMDKVIKYIHDLIASAKPGARAIQTRTMREFVDEVTKILPKGKLLILLSNKMQNSKDFQAFFKELSSDKARKNFEEVRKLPEVQKILDKLKSMNLDIQKVLDFVYQILGWKQS